MNAQGETGLGGDDHGWFNRRWMDGRIDPNFLLISSSSSNSSSPSELG